jgi:hypothetical protein
MGQTSDREESLAETLLDRLQIPKTPVVHDELQKEEDEGSDHPKKETAGEAEETEDEAKEKAATPTMS